MVITVMKKVLIFLVLVLIFSKPVVSFADELGSEIIQNSDNQVTELLEDPEGTYALEFTEDEKAILLDSIQTIRAILVFILVAIVFFALFKFMEWFF